MHSSDGTHSIESVDNQNIIDALCQKQIALGDTLPNTLNSLDYFNLLQESPDLWDDIVSFGETPKLSVKHLTDLFSTPCGLAVKIWFFDNANLLKTINFTSLLDLIEDNAEFIHSRGNQIMPLLNALTDTMLNSDRIGEYFIALSLVDVSLTKSIDLSRFPIEEVYWLSRACGPSGLFDVPSGVLTNIRKILIANAGLSR